MSAVSINLYQGREFNPYSPKTEDIDPETIAVVLSRKCRFGGHLSRFYSVAAHSIHVTELVDNYLSPEIAHSDRRKFLRAALLHDAHEAYSGFGDVIDPMKGNTPMVDMIEKGIDRAVARRFVFNAGLFYSRVVRRADHVARATEREHLAKWPWHDNGKWQDPDPAGLNVDHIDRIDIVAQAFLEKLESLY